MWVYTKQEVGIDDLWSVPRFAMVWSSSIKVIKQGCNNKIYFNTICIGNDLAVILEFPTATLRTNPHQTKLFKNTPCRISTEKEGNQTLVELCVPLLAIDFW